MRIANVKSATFCIVQSKIQDKMVLNFMNLQDLIQSNQSICTYCPLDFQKGNLIKMLIH